MKLEKTLEFTGIPEEDVIGFSEGVLSTLTKLGIEYGYDETSPPDQEGNVTFRVCGEPEAPVGADSPDQQVPSSAAPRDSNRPDWTRTCRVCGQPPIVPATGMCGPCAFGEASTINGNW